MDGIVVNEELASAEFSKLKTRHKYIIQIEKLESVTILRASSILNRLSCARIEFKNLSDTLLMSKNDKLRKECSSIYFKIEEKYWILEDFLSELNVSVNFVKNKNL